MNVESYWEFHFMPARTSVGGLPVPQRNLIRLPARRAAAALLVKPTFLCLRAATFPTGEGFDLRNNILISTI